jgi:hypothetical protein
VLALLGALLYIFKELFSSVRLDFRQVNLSDALGRQRNTEPEPINNHLIGMTGEVVRRNHDSERPMRIRLGLELWPARLEGAAALAAEAQAADAQAADVQAADARAADAQAADARAADARAADTQAAAARAADAQAAAARAADNELPAVGALVVVTAVQGPVVVVRPADTAEAPA